MPLGPDVPSQPPATPKGSDPEPEALLAESIGLALLIVLDTLSPAERVAFVLHDVRRAIRGDRADRATQRTSSPPARKPRAPPRPARGRKPRDEEAPAGKAGRRLPAAARNGEFDRLLALLDPDVVLNADQTAVQMGAAQKTRGAADVAEYCRRARGARPTLLNGTAAALWMPSGQPRVVYSFTISGEKITAIDLIADPARLRQLDLVIPND